ncbi:glutaredoxin family protein [Actinophytocola xanthii]|uniref:NrdH-redoxin n=1 Tax=Actinophytocola xanthii TaxID=1912961 RepID=A0A1Q8CN40_9PSEU|nr:glutaredoxin family protein [Actinophytocola xanthii]OLF15770.1 NrdH-redoxin [Actinophytocola xanthii]
MVARVTVVSREGCHLCEVAEADVARICAELDVEWDVRDVDADPELRAEYGDYVPVILVDDEQHGYWRVEEDRLRAALAPTGR